MKLTKQLLSLAALVTALLLFPVTEALAQATPPSTPPSTPQASSASAGTGLIWDFPGGMESYKDAPFVPGELLVGVHEIAMGAASFQAQLSMDIVATLDMSGLNGTQGDLGISAYRVRVPAGSEWATVERLATQPEIAFVTPNWLVRAAAQVAHGDGVADAVRQAAIEQRVAVNDPLYTDEQWYLQRINASRAWGLALNSAGAARTPIRVAIVDSGVDTTHPEITPHLLPGKNYVSADPTAAPMDDYGHGTHVAGVIAATFNNGSGMSGLAPWVEIDPRKVLNGNGSGSLSDVATAIRDATDAGAHIINLSLEAPVTSPVLDAAVDYASLQNVLMIGAAGNCSRVSACPTPVRWPAAYPEVMAVGSTDYWDQRAYYSAVGTQLEIVAPGGVQENGASAFQIYSTWSIGAVTRCAGTGGNYQFIDGGSYCNSVGTSMSAAVVSGVAALTWSVAPELLAEEVRLLLNRTAHPLPLPADNVGSGRVDAYAALLSLVPPAVAPYPDGVFEQLSVGTEPYSLTLTLENPSIEPLSFVATFAQPVDWVTLTNAEIYSPSAAVRFGEPQYLTMRIDPSALITGSYSSDLTVLVSDDQGDLVEAREVPIRLSVGMPRHYRYLPFVGNLSGDGAALTRTFRWEAPNEAGRTVRTLTDSSNVGVRLPFALPVGDETYTDLRLYSDGYITFPAESALASNGENQCMPIVGTPPAAVYGWWADLDPTQGEGRVSYFETDEGSFVIEFLDVESALSVSKAYTVSFQIVLHPMGDIRLNYLTVPEFLGPPARATLGLSRADGRFHNQIFCADGDSIQGLVPNSRQSFELKQEDLY